MDGTYMINQCTYDCTTTVQQLYTNTLTHNICIFTSFIRVLKDGNYSQARHFCKQKYKCVNKTATQK